jgi:hypothetical protein
VYTFTTAKLQPSVTQSEGKNLIQACLNAPRWQLPSQMPVGAPIGRSSGLIPMATPSHQNVSGGLSINSKTMMAKSLNGLTPVRNVEEVPLPTNPILLLLGMVAVPLHPMRTHVPLPLLNPRTLQMPCCPSKHPHYGLPWCSTSRRCSGAPQPSWGLPYSKQVITDDAYRFHFNSAHFLFTLPRRRSLICRRCKLVSDGRYSAREAGDSAATKPSPKSRVFLLHKYLPVTVSRLGTSSRSLRNGPFLF